MARPERNNVDYFPHDCDHGRKMHVIEAKYGNDGYAVWFKLLEQLGRAEYHYLNLTDSTQVMYLASICRVTEEVLFAILEDLAKMGAINEPLFKEERVVFSEKFVSSIKDAYARRANNCITLQELHELLHVKGLHKPTSTTVNSSNNPQRISKDSKVKEIKVNPAKAGSVCIGFKLFWDAYDKKVDKDETELLWNGQKKLKNGKKLTDEDRKNIMVVVPKFVKSTPVKQYRPGPHKFLYNRKWEDEVVHPEKNEQGWPRQWSREYEKKLQPVELMQWRKFLREEVGLVAIKNRRGDIVKWGTPEEKAAHDLKGVE